MKYQGSKSRIVKYILPIILRNRKSASHWYVEPFCGGCNSLDKVMGSRIGNDINPYLIAMYQALQLGWKPPKNISESEYQHIKNNKGQYDRELVGFVGFGCSFAGKWFGGYARGNQSNGKPRNYCDESRRNVLKQIKKLDGVLFTNLNYWDLYIPNGSTVYCDPPYENTTKYNDDFDHDLFWDWVRNISKYCDVYISEYNAPDDFECLWSKEIVSSLDLNTGNKKGIEKLFTKRRK